MQFVGGGGESLIRPEMVSVQTAPVASVTVTVAFHAPEVVGVPEIRPDGSSVNPSGNASVVVNVRGPVPKVLLSV
jgi:hypothetical protein